MDQTCVALCPRTRRPPDVSVPVAGSVSGRRVSSEQSKAGQLASNSRRLEASRFPIPRTVAHLANAFAPGFVVLFSQL